MDIGVKRPVTEERLKRQAAKFRKFLDVCLRAKNCTAFATWCFTDKHSWINDVGRADNVGSALLFDENYVKKHAYKEVLHALKYTR
jgi:endo-1,4-beta-xylanase